MIDKWYNSKFANMVGLSLICLGIGSCYYFGSTPSNPSQLQKADLNGNNKPEEFYTIDSKTAVTEVDDEPILDFLKKQEEKK